MLKTFKRNPIARKAWRAKTRIESRRTSLRRTLPLNFNLELTSRCNLNCRYCGREHVIGSKRRDAGDMPYELVEKIVGDYAEIARTEPNDKIVVAPDGLGDPLLYPKLFEAMSLVREKIPNADIQINTNGLLLNKANIKRILESELDRLIVSINTWSDNDYEYLHKIPRFSLVKDNIVNLLEARQGGRPKVVVQILDIALNRPRVGEFRWYWEKLGPDRVHVRPFIPLSESVRRLMPKEDLQAYRERLGIEDGRRRKRYPCPALFRSVMVDKDGYIYPCCYGVWSGRMGGICLGNAKEMSVAEAYKRGIPSLRKLHMEGRWGEIEACSDCNFWTVMQNIFFKMGKRWI